MMKDENVGALRTTNFDKNKLDYACKIDGHSYIHCHRIYPQTPKNENCKVFLCINEFGIS